MQEYRKKWAIRMMNYWKKMKQYDGDEMENVIPPERLEIWDMRHILVTYNEVYFYANDDNSSFWVEDKESIIKKKTKEADATRLGLDQEARVIIKLRKQADGYWKNEKDGIILEDQNLWTGQRLDCQRKEDDEK
ncbi:22301_t:CDS:2, partial [Gigaspora rosea]